MLSVGSTTTALAKEFYPAADNDVITLNGTTKGGIAYTYLEIEAVGAAVYLVRGALKGSGAFATPFADS
jgi:hypothetical protein